MAEIPENGRKPGSTLDGVEEPLLPIYVDDQPGLKYWDVGTHPEYERHSHDVIGEEPVDEEEPADQRLCFNCGSASHAVSSCPEPSNRELIALSRQLFNFFKGEGSGEFLRIHEVEARRQQRVEWLESFEPGQIRGSLLREALGLEGEDVGERVEWLQNMAMWGYPKGWVGDEDPRLRVWRTIQERAEAGPVNQEECPFFIHGEHEHAEQLLLPPLLGSKDTDELVREDDAAKAREPSSLSRRWAHYPGTYFSSALLPIYNGYALPPVGDHSSAQSATFSDDRQALWNNIVKEYRSPSQPLPPPPPMSEPPPLPSTSPHLIPPRVADNVTSEDSDGEEDMDLSDSD